MHTKEKENVGSSSLEHVVCLSRGQRDNALQSCLGSCDVAVVNGGS